MTRRGVAALSLALAFAGIVASGFGSDRASICVRADCGPRLMASFHARIRPTALPEARTMPVALSLRSRFWMSDGSQPPSLREATFQFDRGGAIDSRGLPACRRGQIMSLGPRTARRKCRAAIVGTGKAYIGIPGARDRSVSLALFNGGATRGTTRVYLQAGNSTPSDPRVLTMRIRRDRSARFPLASTVLLPPPVVGSRVIVGFKVNIKRFFFVRHRRWSYISARCTDGKIVARASYLFMDRTKLMGTVVRPCSGGRGRSRTWPFGGRAVPGLSISEAERRQAER
jgi:hypothetical protein